MKLVIVTGMSGAGKTVALKMFEDLGFYCVDNMPVPLLEKFAELLRDNPGEPENVAMGVDIRSGAELPQLEEILDRWRAGGMPFQILFLDAGDEVLIKRYKETRRSHPLAGNGRLDRGIAREREQVAFLKSRRTTFWTPARCLPGSCGRSWPGSFPAARSTKTCL